MVNHQIVRRRAKRPVYGKDNTIGNGDNFRAARGGQVYTKVNAPGSAVSGKSLAK
jgi:hypothetical protein